MDAAEDDRLDRDLVEQAQHGDREAFAILARTHGDRLMAIAQRILRDVGRAEDAVQQTLEIAWRELPRLRDPDRFDAWLQRLLVNASYAEARRSRAWNANVRILPVDGPAGPDETLSIDDRDRLERGFRRLPPDQRAVDIGTSVLAETQGFLFDQPVEKGLGGAGMPRGIGLAQGFDDFTGRARALGPDHFHDFPLGVRDSRYFSHDAIRTITVVIELRLHL